MKTIRILFPLALTLWIAGAAVIAFGNAATFGFSWLMHSAGSIVSGGLLILIFSNKYLNQIKLTGFSRIIIFLLILCFYLVLPAGAIAEWIASLAGVGDLFSRAEVVKNLGFPLFFYILFLDVVNVALALLICVGLIFSILRLLLKLNSSEKVAG